MEYTFRNSHREEPQTVVLSEWNITVQHGRQEKIVAYSSVREVHIEKSAGKFYKTVLHTHEGDRIEITNRFFDIEKNFVDNARGYATFIRVLHFHLKDKSHATFHFGTRQSRIWAAVLVAVLISFSISFLADFIGIGFYDPLLQGLALSTLAAGLIITANASQWPKTYQPTNIPLDFLP